MQGLTCLSPLPCAPKRLRKMVLHDISFQDAVARLHLQGRFVAGKRVVKVVDLSVCRPQVDISSIENMQLPG